MTTESRTTGALGVREAPQALAAQEALVAQEALEPLAELEELALEEPRRVDQGEPRQEMVVW